MQAELFSDGISEITIKGSTVRVDLVSFSATERDADNNPVSVFRQRIVFPIEAFANSVEVMQKALDGLLAAGAVTRVQPFPARPAQAAAPERPQGAAEAPALSPNFA